MEMTRKQTRFVAEYAIDLNSTKAAIRAGYSAKTAKQQGSRLLTKVDVADEIRKATQARMQRLEITADKVLQELAKLAFFDVRELFNADGSPKRIHELDGNTAAGIAGFECFERQIDLVAFMKRVRSLARLEGMQLFSQQLGIVSDEQKRRLKHKYNSLFASILTRATR
jgi:phage terminase small subunit